MCHMYYIEFVDIFNMILSNRKICPKHISAIFETPIICKSNPPKVREENSLKLSHHLMP